MRYLDVCAGISASTVAWKPLGWEAAAYSEIEAAPRAILSHHYPDTPLHGDFTTILGNEYGPVDLLVGGTPCQDFSVAGLRAGLDGDRGNLSLEYLRLADRARPRWMVWENVPGVLSIDGGRAFGAILGGLGELGYGFAYRILDAQHFGVPQRRRRVFVVGYLGDHRRAAAVLFERHSLSGHPAPSREAGQGVANALTDRPDRGGGNSEGQRLVPQGCSGAVAPTLNAAFGSKLGLDNQHIDAGAGLFVAHALHGEGFDANEDGTGRGTPLVPVPFDTTQITSAANYSRPQPGDPCHPLAAGAHPPAIAYRSSGNCGDRTDALTSANDMAAQYLIQAYQPIAGTLKSCSGKSGTPNGAEEADRLVGTASVVRRLTPRECERLQGFPDDYTLVPHRGKPMADGPRYKALGNSMAVPVMRWIGERIAAVEVLSVESFAA